MNCRKLVFPVIFFIMLVSAAPKAFAQCSMCRAAAASNLKQGENKRGSGLNHAILYLMAIPYVLGGVAFYMWKKNKGVKDSI